MRACKRSVNYENFQLAEISVLIASSVSLCSLGGVGMGCVVLTGPWEKQTGAGEVMMCRHQRRVIGWSRDRSRDNFIPIDCFSHAFFCCFFAVDM